MALLCSATIGLGATAAAEEAYKARIREVLYPAVIAQLAKNRIPGTVNISLTVDRRGRQNLLGVSSSPKNRKAEEITAKVIRSLKFPPWPKDLKDPPDLIWIKSEISPKPK